jgi:twitching motility protein PilT
MLAIGPALINPKFFRYEVMAKLDDLFKIMKEQKASDLHITTGAAPYLRIHGDMVRLNYRDLSAEETQALLFEILTERQKKVFVENWELDCTYAAPGVGRMRVNIYMQRKGLGGSFRFIPDEILPIEKLDLPRAVLDLVSVDRGLVLVTGPTGSGKSTTLASMIDYINQSEKGHIITVEDPIEFVHQNKNCLVNQREIASHTKSFAKALKAALREDPDIILVGEMRDLETISLAMTAAETGHLVLGTLHTNNAAKTVDRIIDSFPAEQQAQVRTMLSESLRGVVAQTLFKRVDKPGRIAAIEILFNTPAVANLIREGKTFQIPSIMQTGKSQGMVNFEAYIQDLLKDGKVSKDDALKFLGRGKAQTQATTDAQGQQAPPQPKEGTVQKPAAVGIPSLAKKTG